MSPCDAPRGRAAEWVLPGHPDRLADAVADAIVQAAGLRDRHALVGVEVAVHRNTVFIDGRIAFDSPRDTMFEPETEPLPIEDLARDVYRSAGYGGRFGPEPEALNIITDLTLGPLVPGERTFRSVSDDQSIVTGYACNSPNTGYLPIEHHLCRELALSLWLLSRDRDDLGLGPDGKVLLHGVQRGPVGEFRLEGVTFAIQHGEDWDPVKVRRAVTSELDDVLSRFSRRVPGFSIAGAFKVAINSCGDFVVGGPYGDNGLSGKKLVVDFYGPRVPIGGGALSGKDLHKADRAGATIARRLALGTLELLSLDECTVHLLTRPGDREFQVLDAAGSRDGRFVDAARAAASLRIPRALRVGHDAYKVENLTESARWGRFFEPVCVDSLLAKRMRTGGTSEAEERLVARYCRDGRICPLPDPWIALVDLLKRSARSRGEPPPPPPLVLAGWAYSSDADKRRVFETHLRLAVRLGVAFQARTLLDALPANRWNEQPDRPFRPVVKSVSPASTP